MEKLLCLGAAVIFLISLLVLIYYYDEAVLIRLQKYLPSIRLQRDRVKSIAKFSYPVVSNQFDAYGFPDTAVYRYNFTELELEGGKNVKYNGDLDVLPGREVVYRQYPPFLKMLDKDEIFDVKTVIPVAVGIIEDNGCFLIGQRNHGFSFGDLWEFPGGKIEPGETGAEAVVREFWEELKISVSVRRELTKFECTCGNKIFQVEAFLLDCPVRDIAPGDAHRQTAWIKAPLLLNYNLCPLDRQVAELLVQKCC